MITKWIEFTVAEESAAAFADEFAKMQSASRPERGCVQYSVFRDQGNGCRFTVLESWQNAADLELHRQSAHMATFKQNCATMIVEKRTLVPRVTSKRPCIHRPA